MVLHKADASASPQHDNVVDYFCEAVLGQI
jgi:hypothetical protein